MKKIVLVLVLGLAVMFANAQTNKAKKPEKVKKTTVKVAELEKPITDNITKDYPGYKTIEAFKLDKKGSISYQVVVKKDTSEQNLFYSKNGVFLRKEKAAPSKQTPTQTKEIKSDKPKTSTGDKPKTSKR